MQLPGLSLFYGIFVQAKTAPAWVLGIAILVLACLEFFGLTGKDHPRGHRVHRHIQPAHHGRRQAVAVCSVFHSDRTRSQFGPGHIGRCAVLILLPQMLSALGILFTRAGFGTPVGTIARGVLLKGSLIAGVIGKL